MEAMSRPQPQILASEGGRNALNTTGIVGSACAPTVVGSMVTGGTFTIPASSAPKYYRLDGPRATKITNISKGVSNVVITYQVLP